MKDKILGDDIMKKTLIFILISIFLDSCGTTTPVNDFFGIQMKPEEENNFKIVSYDEIDGIKYQSSPTMDNDVLAWAEINPESIVIKIVNNSPRAIPLNYFSDNFILITDQKEYILNKGKQQNYFSDYKLLPGTDDEQSFKLPSDFAQDFVKRGGAILNKDIMGDFSKNWSQHSILKDNLKYILIKLTDVILVLKRVPEKK